jgi:hypothetical protein
MAGPDSQRPQLPAAAVSFGGSLPIERQLTRRRQPEGPVCHGDQLATRAVVMPYKTQRTVQFEITQATRDPFRNASSKRG